MALKSIWNGKGQWYGWALAVDKSHERPILLTPNGFVFNPKDVIVGPIIGRTEAAQILGWDPRHIDTYRNRGKFPEPITVLSCGPIWQRGQIEKFMNQRLK